MGRILTSLIVQNSVTNIGYGAFYGCANVVDVTLGDRVTIIGDYAFCNCTSLSNIALDDGVTNIGNYAFYNCIGLTNIALDEGLTSIGSYAFGNCAKLAQINFGTGIISLDSYAFSYCSSLSSVTIPQTVNSIGTLAFEACSTMTNITVDQANELYSSSDGVLLDKTQTTLIEVPAGLAGSYVVPEGVTNVGDYAFYQCTFLTNLTIPKSVTFLGTFAFGSCENLTSVYFDGDAPLPVFYPFYLSTPTVYYFPGTVGWTQFLLRVSLSGSPFPGALRTLPYPLVLNNDPSFGVQSNSFGFTIAWATNMAVIIEASTDLIDWQPVQTNALSNGTFYFSDPQWTNYPDRFYRISSP